MRLMNSYNLTGIKELFHVRFDRRVVADPLIEYVVVYEE
jgi:hypothetical protein